jgi:uncharacterized protein (TIRG00374 family)
MIWVVYIFLGVFVNILSIFFLSLRYKSILKHIGVKISATRSFYLINICQFINYIIPAKVGTVLIRPLLTKIDTNAPIKKAFFAVLFEQVYETGWELMLLPFLILAIGEKTLMGNLYLDFILIAMFLLFISFTVLKRDALIAWAWRLKRIAPRRLKRRLKEKDMSKEKAKRILDEFVKNLSNKALFSKMFLLTLASTLVIPLMLNASGEVFGVSISYVTAFLVLWTSYIIGRISGIPGGLVVRDAAVAGLLVIFGMNPIVAVQVTVLFRFICIIPLFLFGLPLFIYYGGQGLGDILRRPKSVSSGRSNKCDGYSSAV